MKSLIPIIIVLALVGGAVGQDMEPSLDRAAGNLAARLGRALPAMNPVPEALALVAERGTDSAVVGALAKALVDDGYRVVFGRRGLEGTSALVIRVSADADSSPHRIVLELEGKTSERFVCLFGDANWLEQTPRGAIQVEGPFRADRDAAVEAAFDQAWLRLKARLPCDAVEESGRAFVHRFPRRLIVTFASASAGQRVYRAHLQLLPDRDTIRAIERRSRGIKNSRFWRPWKGVGAMVLLALAMGFAYVGTDLKTRGYMTGTLRFLFGILFLIGVFVCWRGIL